MKKNLKGLIIFIIVAAVTVSAQEAPVKAPTSQLRAAAGYLDKRLVWKSDIWFGDKTLGLKATVAGVIHYCQLGKLNVDWK